ncbi:hypothetical protein MKZ38_003175 [Zalerion maritima]|uniref:Uncharacterized protein n=1 Tax=Zalerion maritima TaxID=339359 RepID=A0AAD5WXP8_9PEZI|nr:hypothetical protein MKZ38_003175 [Zalerion maritima]
MNNLGYTSNDDSPDLPGQPLHRRKSSIEKAARKIRRSSAESLRGAKLAIKRSLTGHGHATNDPPVTQFRYVDVQEPLTHIVPQGDMESGRYRMPGGTVRVWELHVSGDRVGKRIRERYPSKWDRVPPLTKEEAELIGYNEQPQTFVCHAGNVCCICVKITRLDDCDNEPKGQPCLTGCVHDFEGCRSCGPIYAWTEPVSLKDYHQKGGPYTLQWVCCECSTPVDTKAMPQETGKQRCLKCCHVRCHICGILVPGGYGLRYPASGRGERHRGHVRQIEDE